METPQPVQTSELTPLDSLEKFLEGQIKSTEHSRDEYLRHASRCQAVADGLRASLAALRAQRAAVAEGKG